LISFTFNSSDAKALAGPTEHRVIFGAFIYFIEFSHLATRADRAADEAQEK